MRLRHSDTGGKDAGTHNLEGVDRTMGRSCTEALEPRRYRGEVPNLLLAEALLAFQDQEAGEAFHAACGLLDLSGTAQGAAVLGMQAAALLEGRTTQTRVATPGALDQTHAMAVRAGAVSFDCVVVLPRAAAVPLALQGAGRLPGAWVAVTDDPAAVPDGVFDLVVTAQNPTLDGARVFRMLAGMLASQTESCMDSHEFLDALTTGPSCRLLDAFLLPGSDEVQFADAGQEALLRRASGFVVTHHMVPGLDTLKSALQVFRSLRSRAPAEAVATIHLPIGQRADTAGGPVRAVDLLLALPS